MKTFHTSGSRPRARHIILLCAVASLAIGAPTREARALDAHAWLGAGPAATRPGSTARQWGPAAQLGLDLGFGDFWGIYGGLDASYHPGGERDELELALDPATVADLFIGLRYNIDVFKYVPYVGLGLIGYLNSPPVGDPATPGLAPGLGAKLTVGLTWRPRRHWSLGGVIELHGAFSELTSFGLYTAALFNVGYHWRW